MPQFGRHHRLMSLQDRIDDCLFQLLVVSNRGIKTASSTARSIKKFKHGAVMGMRACDEGDLDPRFFLDLAADPLKRIFLRRTAQVQTNDRHRAPPGLNDHCRGLERIKRPFGQGGVTIPISPHRDSFPWRDIYLKSPDFELLGRCKLCEKNANKQHRDPANQSSNWIHLFLSCSQ